MSDTPPEWAGNPVPWNPELSDVVPSATPVPGADTWTVPFEDFTTPDNAFTAPDNPFALEMRAETIEQLVGGDSLRRGESECVEAGRSGTNADLVGGRDRVQAQGRLHEHTGRDFAAQAAHLEATVDGSLDVHAVRDDTVLHAGHMVEEWEGGTAVLAGIADDLVAGGGVRVTAPLDLWVHGLMGVEERIGTCTADAVLAEFAATHYEREYGSGVHRAAVAVLQGKLYQTTRNQFAPLMKLSTGVRNLVAGGGDGGGGSAPGASAPATPPPGEGGASVEAASETLSIATDSARSMEGGVEGAVRMEDGANLRRIADAADAGTETDPRTYPPPAVTLERVDSESVRSTGSASSEGLVRPGWMDELFADADVLLADIRRSLEDPGATPGAEELSGLGHPAGSAEQLAALRRGEFATDAVSGTGMFGHESVNPGVLEAYVPGDGVPRRGSHGTPSDASTVADSTPDSSPWSDSRREPPPLAFYVLDFDGNVNLSAEAFEAIRSGDLRLDVVNLYGQPVRKGTYDVFVEGEKIAEFGDLYPPLPSSSGGWESADDSSALTARSSGDPGNAPALPPHTVQVSAIMNPVSVHPPAPSDASGLPRAGGAGVDRTREWSVSYQEWITQFHEYERQGNWRAAVEYGKAVAEIDTEVWDTFVRIGGASSTPEHRLQEFGDAATGYRALEAMARAADDSGNAHRAVEIGEVLDAIDRRILELSANLAAHAGDMPQSRPQGSTNAGARLGGAVAGEGATPGPPRFSGGDDPFDPHRTGSPGDWRGRTPGSSGDSRRHSFGQASLARAPQFGAPESSTSGAASFRERVVTRMMQNEALRAEEEIGAIHRRFIHASRTREIDLYTPQWESMAGVIAELVFRADFPGTSWDLAHDLTGAQWQAMDELLRLFDTPTRPR